MSRGPNLPQHSPLLPSSYQSQEGQEPWRGWGSLGSRCVVQWAGSQDRSSNPGVATSKPLVSLFSPARICWHPLIYLGDLVL